MSLFEDSKYVSLISGQLQVFKKIKDNVFNFRCPYCGDSQESEYKARGYLYPGDNGLHFKCHNCPESKPFYMFLKEQDAALFNAYTREKFMNGNSDKGGMSWQKRKKEQKEKRDASLGTSKPKFAVKPKPTEVFVDPVLQNLQNINQLPEGHPCRVYVESRKIPRYRWKDLFYTGDFQALAARFDPQAAERLVKYESRLVIPFFDKEKNVLAFQGRSLDPKCSLRYITIKKHQDYVKCYGMEYINEDYPVRIIEGPIDSMFVFNCVASADADLTRIGSKYDNKVLLFDNQPRNKSLLNIIDRAIKRGYPVVIFPEGFEGKDVNDLILDGMSAQEIDTLINNRTFTGLKAKLEFSKWRKL